MDDDYNPFQSPQATAITPSYLLPDGLRRGKPIVPFASGHVRAMFTMSLLGLMALLDLIGVAAFISQYNLLDAIAHGQQFDHAVLLSNDQLVQAVVICNKLTLIVTGIAFLMWCHRTYRNLPALGAPKLETTPGWAVGWYFVPFASLIKPYQTMSETWRYSDPAQQGRLRKSTSALVGFWWGAFVFSLLFDRISTVYTGGENTKPTLQSLKDATMMAIAVLAVEFVAAILAIMVVYWVNRNQQAMHDLITTTDQASAAIVR